MIGTVIVNAGSIPEFPLVIPILVVSITSILYYFGLF